MLFNLIRKISTNCRQNLDPREHSSPGFTTVSNFVTFPSRKGVLQGILTYHSIRRNKFCRTNGNFANHLFQLRESCQELDENSIEERIGELLHEKAALFYAYVEGAREENTINGAI